MASSPDPRYYKDGHGFHPRWRLFLLSPRTYLWLKLPMWLKLVYIRWKDRRHA